MEKEYLCPEKLHRGRKQITCIRRKKIIKVGENAKKLQGNIAGNFFP